jgi:hypothetical protein
VLADVNCCAITQLIGICGDGTPVRVSFEEFRIDPNPKLLKVCASVHPQNAQQEIALRR